MQNIDEIYKEHAETVYKYIFCLTGEKDISEEIVQETFEVAVKNIDKFRNECKISTWLCQIAKYIWYNELKKTKKYKTIPLEEIEDTVVSDNIIEENICLNEDKLELFKKIQKLDQDTRNVMYLRILGNLEYQEIAEVMGRTSSWARVIFFRGKQRIKEEK